jgi:hypothetical protein
MPERPAWACREVLAGYEEFMEYGGPCEPEQA